MKNTPTKFGAGQWRYKGFHIIKSYGSSEIPFHILELGWAKTLEEATEIIDLTWQKKSKPYTQNEFLDIPRTRAIKAKYIPQTNHKPARISLSDEKTYKVFSYQGDASSVLHEACNILKRNLIEIESVSVNFKNHYIINVRIPSIHTMWTDIKDLT